MTAKRKAMAGMAVVSLAVLIVAGTFAWTNFNSQRLNEWRGAGTYASPDIIIGGTLHDDYVENEPNKDIYVENWGDEPLFVRIRLREYMEIGPGAGLKSEATDPSTGKPVPNPKNLAKPLIDGTDIDDINTWTIHGAAESIAPTGWPKPEECDFMDIHSYWEWKMGGDKLYYPAPESLREDKSYVDTNSPAFITASDFDFSVPSLIKRTIRTIGVIRMVEYKLEANYREWLNNRWVLDDSDGWFYWAMPLEPGEATALVLDRVTLKRTLEEDYYYAIYVEAQMATKDGTLDSNGLKDNYERFGDEEQGGWSNDGQKLMEELSKKIYIKSNAPIKGDIIYAKPGDTLELSTNIPADWTSWGKHEGLGLSENGKETVLLNLPSNLAIGSGYTVRASILRNDGYYGNNRDEKRIVIIGDNVEPALYMEEGMTRIGFNQAILNGVIYVKQGDYIEAAGEYYPSFEFTTVSFYPRYPIDEYEVLNGDGTVRVHIKPSAPVGFSDTIRGSIDFRPSVPEPTGVLPPWPPLTPSPVLPPVTDTSGPVVTVPYVVIPVDCNGVVFGKSGKVYIDYGDNTYQELKDDGTLGAMIGFNEVK